MPSGVATPDGIAEMLPVELRRCVELEESAIKIQVACERSTAHAPQTPIFDFLRQKSGNFCDAPPEPAVGCLDPPRRFAVAQSDRMDHPGQPRF